MGTLRLRLNKDNMDLIDQYTFDGYVIIQLVKWEPVMKNDGEVIEEVDVFLMIP